MMLRWLEPYKLNKDNQQYGQNEKRQTMVCKPIHRKLTIEQLKVELSSGVLLGIGGSCSTTWNTDK